MRSGTGAPSTREDTWDVGIRCYKKAMSTLDGSGGLLKPHQEKVKSLMGLIRELWQIIRFSTTS